MVTRFPYAAFGHGSILKPAIDVRLHGCGSKRGSNYPVRMLPDSGADNSCFPEAYASILGIDLADCSGRNVDTAGGITRHFDWSGELMATIAGETIPLTASFGQVGVPVLGRRDFFAHFEVLFNEQRQRVLIKPFERATASGTE